MCSLWIFIYSYLSSIYASVEYFAWRYSYTDSLASESCLGWILFQLFPGHLKFREKIIEKNLLWKQILDKIDEEMLDSWTIFIIA